MNAWDFFTWAMAIALGVGSIVVFAYFLRDARALLRELKSRDD